MNEQILLYQQVINSQLSLRKTLQGELLTTSSTNQVTHRLLDIIDEQVSLLNELIMGLKNRDK